MTDLLPLDSPSRTCAPARQLLWSLMSQSERRPDISSVAEHYRLFAAGMANRAFVTLNRADAHCGRAERWRASEEL